MGCVAAGEDGAQLGKGGGFADLEFALAAAADRTPCRSPPFANSRPRALEELALLLVSTGEPTAAGLRRLPATTPPG
jgi:hypothetical protein